MPNRLLALLIGGLLLVPAGTALAAPANVTLRVEGAADTLVARTALRTDNRIVNKDGVAGHNCSGTSAAGALEIGTGGDWTGAFFAGLGYTVERVKGESHVFPEPDFYELWINNRSQSVGICGAELQEGDDVLLFVARCVTGPPPDFLCLNPPVLPLDLIVPETAAPGAPFDARVVQYAANGTSSPVAGATIEGADGSAVTTNAAGVAAVSIAAGGPRALRATKPGNARSASKTVCATTGADGFCGTAAAGTGPAATASCDTNGGDGRCGTRDRTPPAARIVGIRDGQRFSRGKGPRTLQVKVNPDPSGILAVKLRLTRTDGPRCTYFSGRTEQFRINRSRCGAASGLWFGVGDREETSYLLPRRLPRGRYVLDVNVIDKAFNRDDARRRGGNRIVFHVG